jgi:ABC-type lipoprotein release transport system permease subunit
MVFAGGALGLGSALLVARLLKTLLYQVGPADPFTFIAVPLLLALVALAATLLPARAGMKVEPAAALRNE